MVWCNMHPGNGQTSITQTGNTTAGSKSDMRPFMLKCLSSVVQRSSWRFLLTDKLRLHLVSVQKSQMQVGNMYLLNMMIVTIHLIHSVKIPAGTICHSCFLLQNTFFLNRVEIKTKFVSLAVLFKSISISKKHHCNLQLQYNSKPTETAITATSLIFWTNYLSPSESSTGCWKTNYFGKADEVKHQVKWSFS